MTDNRKVIEALDEIKEWAYAHKSKVPTYILIKRSEEIRAALQNAQEVVTVEQFKEECRDCFIYSNVKSIAKMMQRLYPNGVRIVDEVK